MGQIITAGATLAAGLRADFAKTYDQNYQGIVQDMGDLIQLGVPSNKLKELYAYYLSTIYPSLWRRGETRKSKGFESIGFDVINKKYQTKIEWFKDDRDDDQIGKLFPRAIEAGKNFATLSERIFFQILQATTDTDLLEAIPNAPDGAAIFATADGAGNDRFGVSSGNLLSGTGVASAATIRADFWKAIEQFTLFEDTEGQPLWDKRTIDQGTTILYAAGNEQAFSEAFLQSITLATVVGQTYNVGGAGVHNVTSAAGKKFRLIGTQRISGNDWFVFLDKAPLKAVFQQVRKPVTALTQVVENSDVARDKNIESVMWDSREGYGVNVPYQAIKIDN